MTGAESVTLGRQTAAWVLLAVRRWETVHRH